VPGIVAYMVLLVAALTWGDLDGTSPWRFVWAALPVLPMVWIAIAVLRHLRRVDEYQRGKLLAGFAVGFAVAMLGSITLGILGTAGVHLEGEPFWIYAAGMIGWGVASAVSGRR
jgi:energy-coupling factor transporter transmembrane protein EcfT